MCLVKKVFCTPVSLGKARCSKALYVQMCFLLTKSGWNMQLLPSQSYQRTLHQEGPFSTKLTKGSLICNVLAATLLFPKIGSVSPPVPLPPPVMLPTWTDTVWVSNAGLGWPHSIHLPQSSDPIPLSS